MKKIKLNAYQVGLVFKNAEYKRLLLAGNYWFWGNEQVLVYNITQPFVPPVELNILLQDKALADILHVVEVKESEIVMLFENDLLKQVLDAGRYAFWKGVIRYKFQRVDIGRIEIDENIDRVLLANKLLASFVRNVSVENHEQAALFVDGKFDRILSSGSYYWWKNNIPVQIVRADMRQQQLEINGQEILTRDKAALRINAWTQYRVVDIEKAVVENKEYDRQLYVTMQLALREYVAGYLFDELLEKKGNIGAYVLQRVEEKAAALGVKVNGFGIRDIILPGEMKEIMNQVLVAEKKAQANSIMRREETASTRSLLNTARLLEENAMLWKLKEMEYVEKIAEKVGNIGVSGNEALVNN